MPLGGTLLVVALDAQRLPIPFVPEQREVATVWHLMVNDGCRFDPADLAALGT